MSGSSYRDGAARLLRGAIDFHIHASPDVRPRKWDYPEVAHAARKAGMAGVVIKSHHTVTGDIAQMLQKETPEVLVAGGVTLNRAVGGFNPEAVKTSFALGGRIVWFPTLDAANELRFRGERAEDGLSIFDTSGKIHLQVTEILELIARHDGILCTGHLAVEETVALVEAAQRLPISRIIVNHPEHVCIAMDVSTQRQLASKGVFLERAYPRSNFIVDMAGLARRVREVGVHFSLIGTDLGQPDAPDPVTGLAQLFDGFAKEGFSEGELRSMSRDLPLRLLEKKVAVGSTPGEVAR